MKKENTKIILILIGLGLILFSVLMIYLIINPAPPSAPVTGKISPTIFKFIRPTIPVVPGDRFIIGDVSTKNFYKIALKSNSNGDLLIEETDDYHLVYFPGGSYFLINILSPNYNQARERAENRLIEILGINEVEACRLRITVATPLSINPDKKGVILPLSFCNQ